MDAEERGGLGLRCVAQAVEPTKQLAEKIADVLAMMREEKWTPFCEAVKQTSIEPSEAVARLVLRSRLSKSRADEVPL